jgi:hypothetical protein
MAQPTNQSLLGFEAQTKKLSHWFWGPNHQTKAVGLRHKPGNPPPPWFWGSTKKFTADFKVKLGETVATSFKAKLAKTVQVVLKSNHSQTIDLGFDAQPRNPRS